MFYEMRAGGLVLLRHNTAEHRRLVAYFLSAANSSRCDRANDVIRGSRRHLGCYFEGHRDLSSHQAGKMRDHLVRNLARSAAYPRGIKRNVTSPFPGTSEVGHCDPQALEARHDLPCAAGR